MRQRSILLPIMMGFLLAGTLAAASATEVKTCPRRQPTPASYTWNFKAEASDLLNQVGLEAANVADRSDRLEQLAADNEVSWEIHASQLARIKSEVNEISNQLCRLETIRRATAPWQKQAIKRLAVRDRELADNTAAMISFLNTHHQELWLPAYRGYANDLYQSADATAHSLQEYVQYAKSHSEERQMEKSLGMKAGS